MIVYNITSQVSWEVHEAWRLWLMEEFIPSALGTALFSHYQLTRLMEVDEEAGATYALQLYLSDIGKFEQFRKIHLQYFENRARERWGEAVLSFSTLMEVIN